MTVYDNNRDRYTNGERSVRANIDEDPAQPTHPEQVVRSGYRPGWIWIPVAVLFLLIVLVLGTGFIYGDYSDRVRGYDNGTRLEQTDGQVTQPNASDLANPGNPELGTSGVGEERSSIPEAAPPLANDGQ